MDLNTYEGTRYARHRARTSRASSLLHLAALAVTAGLLIAAAVLVVVLTL